MATAVTSQRIASQMALKLFDHDPGGTTAIVVSGDGGTTKNYVPIAGYELFGLLVMNSVSASSSGPTTVAIQAAEDSTGTNATVILSTTPGTPSTHVGDNIWLEITAAQIAEVGKPLGYNFTHVTGLITCSNAGDECVVGQFRLNPKFPKADLTVNNIT